MLRLTRGLFKTSKFGWTLDSAVADIPDGSKVLVGGFGLCGHPHGLIEAVRNRGTKELTIVSNTAGIDDYGLGILMHANLVKRMICSYVGENKIFAKRYFDGDLEVELVPQGTLAEKMRAGGAGIPAFYSPASVATFLQTGEHYIRLKGNRGEAIKCDPKPVRTFDGRDYVEEKAIKGDYALIQAHIADEMGNLYFRGATRNFNPHCATAADKVIAEVRQIVKAGELAPESIHLPGNYVDRIVLTDYTKRFEKKTLLPADSPRPGSGPLPAKYADVGMRERLARRCALDMQDGWYVNLGIGIPQLVANVVPAGVNVVLESENGILGLGPYPTREEDMDADLINAGKETVTYLPGTALMNSADTFGMIRGGHLDMTVLGAMQVSSEGDLSNWVIPGKMLKGPGGAMDLVASGSKVTILMQHVAKNGQLKLLKENALPLTGRRVVDQVITDLCLIKFDKHNPNPGKPILAELAPNVTVEQVLQQTGFEVDFPAGGPKTMKFSGVTDV